MTGQWQIEWGKLLLLLVALLAGFGLIFAAIFAMKTGDARFASTLAFGTGTVGTVLGYATGNGRLASRGEAPVPMLRHPSVSPPKPPHSTTFDD